MSNLELAQARFTKADKILRFGLGIFVGFAIIVFIFVSVELYSVQSTIARNQQINSQASADRFKKYTDDNAAEHAKTQAYVKCIAQVLLQPIDQRTDATFDQCSAPIDSQTIN